MPGIIDHLLVAAILVGIPLHGVMERRHLKDALAAGEGASRLATYARTILWQWSAAVILIFYWMSMDRAFSLLGLRLRADAGFLIGAALGIFITSFFVVQNRKAEANREAAAQVRLQAASLLFLLPSTPAELRRFTWLGVTAGIVEELICRGFMIWYFVSFVPIWPAIVLSSLAFGIGHWYQGPSGVLKTAVVGLVLGGLYQLSGSLWVPMFVHAAADVLQGRMVYFATTSVPPEDVVHDVAR